MVTVALFEDAEIRREWYQDERRFSVVDVVAILTGHSEYKKAKSYWTTLKGRLKKEGSEVVTNCDQLKFTAADGKKYKSDAANTKTVLRIIQSVPSPNAEPIKQWLASLGNQRVEESNDPELGIQRARERAIQAYYDMGMSDTEIVQRLRTIDIRHDYTDELKKRGITSGFEYATLTNISYTRSGKTAKEYKHLKGLTVNDNLRDHMSMTELLLTGLSEEAGKEIAKTRNATGFEKLQDALLTGAKIAKNTREHIESELGTSILQEDNRLQPKQKAIRQKAIKQESLGYNAKKKKKSN